MRFGFSSSSSTVPITQAAPKTSLHCWPTPIQIERHLVIERLSGPIERARAVATLAPLLEDIARFDAPKSARQGRIATALMLLGEEGRVWPLFAQTDDPSVRTELVHNLAAYGVDISTVVGRLKTEPDSSARRALLLSLGGFPPKKLPDADREAFATDLLKRYRTDPDPGVHAAINWLLRTRWGLANEVETADHEYASSRVPTDRDWYVNSQGQTYSIIRGPTTFRMGSTPRVVPDLLPSEPDHAREIPRSYAISSREVTMREYGRFLDTKTTGVTDNRADPLYRAPLGRVRCGRDDLVRGHPLLQLVKRHGGPTQKPVVLPG